jgi:iron complex outermembrane receptor protein
LACAQLANEQAKGAGFYTVQSTLPNPDTLLKQWQINNTTTWRATDTLTIKNIASYAQLDEKYRSALFGTNFFFAFPPFIPLPGIPLDFAQSIPLPGGSTAKESTATEEIQLQGRALEGRLNWQSGVYLEDVEPLALVGSQSPVLLDCTNSDTFNCINPIRAGSINYTAGKTYFFDLGVYEQATYDLTDTLKVTEGLRYTDDRTHNNAFLRTYLIPQPGVVCTDRNLTPPLCAAQFKESSSAPTWLLGLDYKPMDDVLVYGKYARGYRAGGVAAVADPALTSFKPEKVDTFEAGLKTSFKGAVSGTFNVAAFYNNFSDQQLQLNLNPNRALANPPSPASGILNIGKSHIYGLEVEASLTPFEGFTLDASYTYLNTKVTQVSPVPTSANSPYIPVSPAAVGDPLALSPKNKAAVTGTYTLPLPDSIGRVAVSATLTHTDSMITNYVDRNATMVVGGVTVPNPTVTPLGTLPALNLLSLDLNWRSIAATHVDLSLFATNVTNKQYYTYVPGLYGTTSFETASIGLPRMYGARVRYSW